MPRHQRPALAAAAARISQECIAMRVRRLGRTVTRIFDDALRPHGLGIAQLTLLVAIERGGALRPFELGRLLDLEKSTVTRNLERMLARGWVRSSPEPDGNGYRVELKPAGRALLERAYPAWSAGQERARRELGQVLEHAVRSISFGGR
jgi:DNA-binding MarR family transcriptional regulator